MQEFITKFKQTSYYRNLFDINDEILLIYIGGSRCRGLVHDFSDYDIDIITLNGTYTNMYWQHHLVYNNKKVHWYYCPLQWYFSINCSNLFDYSGILALRELSEAKILYKNPKYEKVLDELYKIREELIVPVCYRIFDIKKDYVTTLLNTGRPLKHVDNPMYFLTLTSYYLLNDPFDKEFLKTIKLINDFDSLADEYRQRIIKRLTLCKNYIEQNPIDINTTLTSLYNKLKLKF